jgi:DNA ligase-1
MTRLGALVDTSQRVTASAGRRAKVTELAKLLRSLAPEEIEAATHYLSGTLPQGRIGIGYSQLQAARPDLIPAESSLTIGNVDEVLTALQGTRGAGSAARRKDLLHSLFARATHEEREFLIRLLTGELRQGAMGGLMVEATAAAAGLPVLQVRRAAMYARDLGTLARRALGEGSAGLERFSLELFSPVAPMLAQTAADPAAALLALPGEVAFEWKLDGARIQVHKRGAEVRIYTRNLNEVTDAIPEIASRARSFAADTLVLDGEAIAMDADGRPHPFQVTMSRFGRKLEVERASTACRYRHSSSTVCSRMAASWSTFRAVNATNSCPQRYPPTSGCRAS